MDKITKLLDSFNVTYEVKGNEIDIIDDGGWITVIDNKAYFIHGNAEPSIDLDSKDLPVWVEKYLEGFDEFEEVCN